MQPETMSPRHRPRWTTVRRISERLWFVDACTLLAELALVWWPIVFYLQVASAAARPADGSALLRFLLRAAPAILILAEVPWWIVVGPRRAALVRAMLIRNAGRPLPSDLRRRVGTALSGLPVLGLWWRSFLIGASAAGLLQLAALRSFVAHDLASLLGLIAFSHAFCAGVLRALWYEHLLELREARLFPEDDPIERLGRRYGRKLQLQSLGTGVLGLLVLGIYGLVFVPLPPLLYGQLEILLALVGFSLLALWQWWVPRFGRSIDGYFAQQRASHADGNDSLAKEHALFAYRASVQVPIWYAVAKLAMFGAAIAIMLLLSTRFLALDREEAGLLGGAAGLIALAVSLYEALVQRSSLRPLRIHLSSNHRLALSDLGRTLSLRGKMVASFGLLAIFSSAQSMYLSFIHYRALATAFIQRETELRLSAMARRIEEDKTGEPMPEAAIAEELRRFLGEFGNSVDEPAVIYFPKQGKALYFGHAVELSGLDPPLQARLFGTRGPIHLPPQLWVGSFTTLWHQGVLRGKLALLQPGYRARGVSTVPQIRVLAIAFLVLIAGSIGIVLVAARDLTEPLRTLAARAVALASGDLGRAVLPSGEADEVGRLTLLFEEMRRALNDRLRSSTEINVALEQEVQKRTSELEGRNLELKQTLDALRHAQDELLRAEKLVSMGRLVAGIAHEINNPVNAIVNTAGPLEQALVALGKGKPTDTELADLLSMLKVIRRGAHRTSEIVQALHSYSRRDDERIAEVDLNRVLDETLDLLRHQLKGITVIKEYCPQITVRGNSGQLGQVFMNLVTNAVQAIGGSGEGGTIRLRTERYAEGAAIEVIDDGTGIPDEVRKRIFDPFFTTKDVGKGSGLGLSIVQSLVDQHGGSITLETSQGPNRGTKFRVELPQVQKGDL